MLRIALLSFKKRRAPAFWVAQGRADLRWGDGDVIWVSMGWGGSWGGSLHQASRRYQEVLPSLPIF